MQMALAAANPLSMTLQQKSHGKREGMLRLVNHVGVNELEAVEHEEKLVKILQKSRLKPRGISNTVLKVDHERDNSLENETFHSQEDNTFALT